MVVASVEQPLSLDDVLLEQIDLDRVQRPLTDALVNEVLIVVDLGDQHVDQLAVVFEVAVVHLLLLLFLAQPGLHRVVDQANSSVEGHDVVLLFD